jgi:co-chaperonin GroES (HSP10)
MDEPEARAQPGDNVILAAFSGYILEGKDGKTYRAVNERDIFLVEDKGEQNG